MLIKSKFDEIEPGTIFNHGFTWDHPKAVNVAGTGKTIKWVACKGTDNDWCIYTDNPWSPQGTFEAVKALGDKLHLEEHVQFLIPCDQEVWKRYRH